MQYKAELHNLAIQCNFGDYLGDALRDRFVCGLRNENIQKSLLSKEGLTLDKAVKTAVAMETAPTPKREIMHKTKPTKPCFRCEVDHKPDKCRHMNTIYRFCSNAGHFEKACLTKRRSTQQCGQKPKNKGGHIIQELDELDSDYQILHIKVNTVQGKHSKPIIVRPTIAGRPVCMELYTGTALSIISEEDYLSIFKDMKHSL